jgi:Putative adhesin
MNTLTRLLAAGLLAALPLAAHAKIERTVEKTFAVQPGGTLTVNTQGGDIRVLAGGDQEVRIVARQRFPRADTEAEADEVMRDLTFELTQQGNDVSVLTKSDRRLSGFNWGNRVQIDFTITVPSRYAADLRTSGGDITVGGLTGRLSAQTSGGDIDLARIDGEINAATSGGDIALAEGTAGARLRTSGGDIRVGRIAGKADLETSGGDIEVRSAGASVDASTSGGDVAATFEGGVPADASLSSSGGDIVARIRQASSFRLDASTSGGNVDAAGLTLTIERGGVGKNRLVGSVNGGGPLLKLRTSGGDIRIIAR